MHAYRFVRVCITLLAAIPTLTGCGVEYTGQDDADGDPAIGSEAESLRERGPYSTLAANWSVVRPGAPLANGAQHCTAVLLPVDGVAEYVLTNQECVDRSSRHDPADYRVGLMDGSWHTVDRIYTHPLANWALTVGKVPERGKVDVALARLSAPVLAGEEDIIFGVGVGEHDIIQESAPTGGYTHFEWEASVTWRSENWWWRMGTHIRDGSGAGGSPIWRQQRAGDALVLEGLRSKYPRQDAISHAIGFRAWVLDALACGPFDNGEPRANFCRRGCQCDVGEGDCDTDADCKGTLVCVHDVGAMVGLPGNYDLCLEREDESQPVSGFCESTPHGCGLYEGDCNSNLGCRGDLVCRHDVGRAVGLPEWADVCDLPRQPDQPVYNADRRGGWQRCTAEHPCALGDGDCDSADHRSCRGFLRCKRDVGLDYGFDDELIDVCVHPDHFAD